MATSDDDNDISIITLPSDHPSNHFLTSGDRHARAVPEYHVTTSRPHDQSASYHALSTAYTDLKKRYVDLEEKLSASHHAIKELKRTSTNKMDVAEYRSRGVVTCSVPEHARLERENRRLESELRSLMRETMRSGLSDGQGQGQMKKLQEENRALQLEKQVLARQVSLLSEREERRQHTAGRGEEKGDGMLSEALRQLTKANTAIRQLKAELRRQQSVIQGLLDNAEFGHGTELMEPYSSGALSSVYASPTQPSSPAAQYTPASRHSRHGDDHANDQYSTARRPGTTDTFTAAVTSDPAGRALTSDPAGRALTPDRAQPVSVSQTPARPPPLPARPSVSSPADPAPNLTDLHIRSREPRITRSAVDDLPAARTAPADSRLTRSTVDDLHPEPRTPRDNPRLTRSTLDDPDPRPPTSGLADPDRDLDDLYTPAPRTCPMCNTQLCVTAAMFERHVMTCVETHETAPSAGGGGERTCPVCQQQFPPEVTALQLEDHVNSHFDPEPYEILTNNAVT